MAEHSLPDDLAEWPEDPCRLLGVKSDCDKKTLRRAYGKLVKKYKPEQRPDEFRRIRDAYEAVLGFIEFRSSVGPWSSTSQTGNGDAADGTNAGEAATQHGDDSSAIGPGQLGVAGIHSDAVRAAWNKARDGDFARAYSQLQAALADSPADEDICLRLYWLLLLQPSLDTQRNPVDWIEQPIKRGVWTQRLLAILIQHGRCRPREAVSEKYSRLIELAGDLGHVLSIVNCRWSAAAKLQMWRLIGDDLHSLKRRFADQPHAWGNALVLGMDHVVWSGSPEAGQCKQFIRGELDQLKDVELDFADEYDRLDFLQELAGETRRLAMTAPQWSPLTNLLTDASHKSFEEVRRDLMRFLRDKVDSTPPKVLPYLLKLVEASETVFMGLGSILKRFFATSSAMHRKPPEPDELRTWFELFRPSLNFRDYRALQHAICRFCLQHQVLPGVVAKSLKLEEITVDQGVTLADIVEGDEVLLSAVIAQLGFWAEPRPLAISDDGATTDD